MWPSSGQYATGTPPNEESGTLAENTPLTLAAEADTVGFRVVGLYVTSSIALGCRGALCWTFLTSSVVPPSQCHFLRGTQCVRSNLLSQGSCHSRLCLGHCHGRTSSCAVALRKLDLRLRFVRALETLW